MRSSNNPNEQRRSLCVDKWNLIVDVARCENCHNCDLATKDEHIGNEFPGYAAAQPPHGHDWIRITRRVRGDAHMVDVAYLPTTCNHCDEAPCIAAAGDGSIYKRADGIVIIDPEKAKGRKDLVDSCPYGAIQWNEERRLPQKWIFDAHLLDQGWKEPRCVQVCPTGALKAVKADESAMERIVRDEGLEVLRPELGAKPRVYYKNLDRYSKSFIGGTALQIRDGRKECAEGVAVTLRSPEGSERHALSDAFGDFKFDGLEPNSGAYSVRITAEGSERVIPGIYLKEESIYLGEILSMINSSTTE